MLQNNTNIFAYITLFSSPQQLLNLSERDVVILLSELMIVSSLITLVAMTLFGYQALYGRYSNQSKLYKFSIPARLAWFLQEVPSFILPVFVIIQVGYSSIHFVNALVLAMFIVHYAQRSFVYPLLIKGGKPTPIHLFFLGIIFCSWNGYIQGLYHAKYAEYSNIHFYRPTSIIGLILFVLGMTINIHSDNILRGLRKHGETGYKIPRGGLFNFVSGANFFGEIVEWIGYSLFAYTITALAFALFTVANTIPRAINHHRWYLEKFDDYPINRKAVIPFIL